MAEEGQTAQHPVVEAQNANKTIVDQTSYSDVVVGPQLDQGFDPHYHGIEVKNDGDVRVQTGSGNERTLALVAGRIYPVEIQKVVSQNTTVPQDEIWVYAK